MHSYRKEREVRDQGVPVLWVSRPVLERLRGREAYLMELFVACFAAVIILVGVAQAVVWWGVDWDWYGP